MLTFAFSCKLLSRFNPTLINKYFLINNKDESIYNPKIHYDDDFAKIINERYMRMNTEISGEYFESNKGTEDYNNGTLKDLIDYMNSNDLRKTSFYNAGVIRAKEII